MTELVVLTGVCVVACGALVYGEKANAVRLRVATKLAASLAFVALGYLATVWNLDIYEHPDGWDAFAHWMLRGLVLGMIGDILLLGVSDRAFLGGLVAFLAGHVAYVVGLAQLVAPADWFADAGLYAALPIIVAGLALALLWRHLGSMRIPVIGYVGAIVAMVIAAIAVARGAAIPSGNRVLLVAGAALFFASDLSVARDKFYAKAFANRAWGLPAYYAGQLLIAWSLALQASPQS
jgi:uncharacterized membrane protein YhhN